MSRSDPLSEPGSERPKAPQAKSGRAAQVVRRLAAVAVLLALVSGTALFVVLYTADADFVAGALSKLLGRRVEIGRVSFHLGRRLEVELEKVKVADPERPGDPPMLEVGRARGVQAWPRLLAGQYLPLDWTLDAPVLRIHTGATDSIDLSALPRLGLHVTDGRVDVTSSAGEVWSLQSLQLEARRAGFGTRVEGDGSARLTRGETPVTELALHFSAARDHAELKGTVAALELAALPKTSVTPRGRGEGGFDFSVSEGAVRGKVHLEVDRFALRIPKLSGPIAPATARVAADVDWRPGSLALELHPLQLDDLIVAGSLRIGSARNGHVVADVTLAPFEPAHSERVNALTFLALRFASWARVKSRIEAGVVEDIHLAVDVPTATLAESLSYDVPMPPDAFVLELRARDGIYRTKPEASPLEHLQGELEIRGEVMDIRRMRMTHEGEPLPEINIHLDGMHRLVHLPDAEDHISGGPGVDLDGLQPLGAALRAGEGQAKEPTVLHFHELAIRMPQFMLPLREAEGELRFPNGGIAADPVRGVLGGSPAQLTANWNRAADRVDVAVQYLEGDAPGGPITGPRWLSANVDFEKLNLPDWPLDEVHTHVAAEGARVTLSDLHARLAGGKLAGTGQLDLSPADRAPFDLEFGVTGFDPKPLCTTFSLPAESVTGRGDARVRVSGALRPGGDFATEGALTTKLLLHEGTVARLPALVAIARLPSLSGVTGLVGRPLPYKTVELDLALVNGKLALSDGKLLGPQLRILANGEMDFSTPQRQTDFVIALLFLQTLDRVLDQVPIVRNVILGEDQNLIAVYLRLQGPRDDLTVTPLPPATVSSIVGFTSSAVMSGVRRLGRLFQPGSAEGANSAPSSEKP
jgi:hypothetical protein